MNAVCPSCNSQIDQMSKFCPECGASLAALQPQPAPTPEPTPEPESTPEPEPIGATQPIEIQSTLVPEPTPGPIPAPTATPSVATPKKPRKKLAIVAALIFILLVIGSCSSMCGEDDSSSSNSSSSSAPKPAASSSSSSSSSSADADADADDDDGSDSEPASADPVVTSIKAKYNGSTEAGVTLDEDADITVTAKYDDGTKAVVYGWKVAASKTLKAGKTTDVKIVFEGATTRLKVKCTTMTRKQYWDSCKSIGYKTLSRNPEKYLGEDVKFTGKVVQEQESWGGYVYRIEVTKGSYGLWDDAVYVTFSGQSDGRILEDDIVDFCGEFTGIETYTTVLGASVSIPSVDAKYIKVK